jgi:hypothetical protein
MKPLLGVSAYAAGAWNDETTDNYFKCFPPKLKRLCTSVLWGPWSNKRLVKFLERFIQFCGEREHLIEIHISAETARSTGRNGRQIAPKLSTAQYDKALREKDPKVLALVKKRVEKITMALAPIFSPLTTLVYSVGLEDNLSQGAAKVLLGAANQESMLTTKVRNPMTQKPRIGFAWQERHGRNIGGTEVHNFDGVTIGKFDGPIEDVSYENALKIIQRGIKENPQLKAIFTWNAPSQGLRNLSGQSYSGRTFEWLPEDVKGTRWLLKEAAK